MYVRYRHRRGVYPLERESRFPRFLRTLITLAVLALIVYWVGSWLLRLVGFSNPLERVSAMLITEQRGTVNVSLQGEESLPAENGMGIFAGDTLSSTNGAHATLRFFDGTRVRIDEKSDLAVIENAKGKTSSAIELTLKQGQVWVATPKSASGTVVRHITTPSAGFTLPEGTEAVISTDVLVVFSAKGEGIEVDMKGKSPFTIGEGQQWKIPLNGNVDDVYANRSPIPAAASDAPFVLQSRQMALGIAAGQTNSSSSDILTITSPAKDATVKPGTLTIRGTVSDAVKGILLNGHDIPVNTVAHTFSQDVTVPDGMASIDVQIKALDEAGNTLDARALTLKIDTGPVQADAPSITVPVATGQTFRTTAEEIVIRGTSPKNATGMMVNDYSLQLFSPEKGTWSYLASTSLGNMKPGTNTYTAYAIAADGTKSPGATITVIWGETSGDAASAGSTSNSPNPTTLPKNAPLEPGTLSITAPVTGTEMTTGTGFLLEGLTAKATASIWVNDYMLQLYKPGKTTWNYIASPDFGNLKTGKNVYHIVARNEKWEIIDAIDFTATYRKE